ncbi:MAG: thermonuclease family protein [Ilumatobacteraceae bacterium]
MDNRFFYSAEVKRVIDGDTFDCVIDLGFDVLLKARVRLYGVNTPESRTKDAAEKAAGLKAKSFTTDWLDRHKTVFIKTVLDKNEKYGRVLANVYSSPNIEDKTTACLNDDIIGSGYARAYFGVGDKTWDEFKTK